MSGLTVIAPTVRSLLRDTLIVIHEAPQLDAAKEIIVQRVGVLE